MRGASVVRLDDPLSVGVATKNKPLAPLRAGKTRESSLESVTKFVEYDSRGVVLGLHDAVEILPNREETALSIRHKVDTTGKSTSSVVTFLAFALQALRVSLH